MKKRIISLLLTVLIVLSLLPVTALAATEEVPEGDGYLVTFQCDEHAKVAVYSSQDYTQTPAVSSYALSLDSSTGLPTKSDGQVNFRVDVDEGYTLASVEVTSGSYKNLKDPSDTGNENTYRITKIASDLVVTVTATAEEGGGEDPEITEPEGYEVTFTGTAHATVSVYPTQDYTQTPVAATSALSVDGDTGIPAKDGEGQVNFRVDAEDGYLVTSVAVTSGTYKNLKGPSDTGNENTYRITKIASDLVVTVSTTAVPKNVPFFVAANSAAGLDGYIVIDFTKSGSSYTGTLYLPGTANTELLKLYWPADTKISIGDAAYESGTAPIPANGESLTYTVTAGGKSATYTVKTMQGSADVEGMFLTIDESMGTIAAMNGDRNHETVCFGQVTFGGDTNFISMKGRGNTTWSDFSKKPYNITFFKSSDYEGDKKKVELIDGTKAKKWSILANAKDPTCLRNKVGYDIADALGIGLPSRSVDIWMNGAFLGNYLLTPKNDYQAPDDGYMVEIDNKSDVDQFTLSGSPMFTVKEMADSLTVNDVKNSVSKAWDALKQSSSDTYLNYFDLDSWAKMYLLNELYKDVDVSAGSIFFTKNSLDDGDKLVAGPIWDLDGTLGRVSQTYVGMDHTHEKDGSGWYIDSITGTAFFQLLGKHESFMKRVYEIYNENKTALQGILDDLAAQKVLIADSAEMNFVRWPQYMTNTEHFTISKDNTTYGSDAYAVTYQKTDNWEAFTNNLKEYITKRLKFFSDNLTVEAPTGSITGAANLLVDDTMSLAANASAGSYQWQTSHDGVNWTNISGATAKTYSAKATLAMNGLQIRCVAKNTKSTINTSRVAKVAPAASATLGPVTLTVSKNGFFVAKNIEAGLDGDVDIAFTKSGSNYSGTLYLPGGADTDKLALSWNGDAVVSVGGVTYESGKAPVPANGESITYAVTIGNTTANYTVKTMQGSEGVKGMFLTIDESMGTIAAMNSDPDHETECFGSATFESETNYISMKGRGNSTWSGFDKKPYNITFFKADDFADKKKVELIDGTKTKKWSILTNAKDPTGLRNKVGYDIADELGIGLPSKSIDVWMNGEFLGNYLLTPKNDYEAPDNGYMVEIDNKTDVDQFTLSNSPKFTVKKMADGLTVDDVKNSVSRAWDALQKSNSDEYLNYFDLDSWAKMYLLNELYKDEDVDDGSIFFTKASMDDGDKLFAGPVWDLDITLGRVSQANVNVDRTTENTGGGWYIDGINTSPTPIFQLLGKHESFMKRVYEIYNEYKAELDGMLDDLDTQSALIADSGDMNLTRWPQYASNMKHYSVTQDTQTYGTGDYAVTYKKTDNWAAYTYNLKEYITKRLSFFSDNLTVTAPMGGSITGATSVAFGDSLTLTADTTAASYQWQTSVDGKNWKNIDGATAKTYTTKATMDLNGLFIRCVAKNTGSVVNTTRVAKVAPSAMTVLEPVTLTVSLEGHEHHYQDVVTKPTCTEKGYTTHTCSCGDVIVDTYVDELGHDYVDGACTRCKERDPAYVPECIVEKNVSLANGTFIFTLGGNRIGEYTFAQSGSGWTIKGTDGKYLGFANNAFTYSDTAFVWTYSNNAFTTSVTSSSSNPWGGYGGFGGWGNWGNTTTTYYLTYSNGRFNASTNSNGSNAGFIRVIENMKHSFGAWTAKNGMHSRTCTVCGEVETGECSYDAWTTVNGVHSHTCSVCHIADSGKCSYTKWTTEDGVHSRTCTICHAEESGECTYGDWTPDENGQHSRACSVCGDKVYENCVFGADHHCDTCGQIDPNLVYVTATFVTGSGASAAPASQTVISGEGKITKPADPMRRGYLFAGWYVDETEFDFDAILTDNVTITAKWEENPQEELFLRIFHLDAGRKYFSVDQIKNIIDLLAENQYTHLELALGNDALRFLLDDMSLSVNGKDYSSDTVTAGISSGNNAYYADPNGNYLTESEMDDIIAYAKEKNVGLIPMINTPGHMDAIIDAMEHVGIANPAYNGSARTVDVTNANAVRFTLALVEKYICYFADKGVKLFNMGCDEYANDKYTSGSMGFGNLISTRNYGSFVTFVNDMAAQIKKAGMTPVAFNDGIYFSNNKSFGSFDTDILIAYWTSGWTNYNVRSAADLVADGFKIINTNDGWYYVLGRTSGGYSLQSAKTAARDTGVASVSGSDFVMPVGSMMCVWCDTPSAGYTTAEVNNIRDLINLQSENNADYFTPVTEAIWPAEDDPGRVHYATAKFVTGTGASAAPASQTVIRGEGRINRPPDPTRQGYIFDGWYAGDDLFNFAEPLTENVTLTARWSKCEEHTYEHGKCVKCGADEPKPEPECIVEKNVSLANGTFIFTLGGNRIGEYTFAQSGSGWTIKGTDGKYLGFANNAFTYSDTAFVWTYSNNAFTTSVTSSSSNPWGGYGGFGGWGNWGNTTTTYYLTYSNGRFNASTNSNGSNAGFIQVIENMKHSYVDVVTAPTCTEQGYTTHTCACGDTYVDSYTPVTSHTYVDVVTAPTCTEKGYTTHSCSCGASYVDSYTDPKGHSYVDVVTKPTCTEKGYTTHTCSCGDVIVDTYVDELGHDYVDGACTRCKERDPAYVPECIAEKNVSLANGTFIFTLSGNRIGEYTFAQSGSGWTIKGTDGKYLGFTNNAFTYSDTAFVWTYSNNAFTTSVTSSSSNPWGGYGGFGGWGNWGNTTTTYYLTYSNGRFNASTNSNGSNAGFIQVIENMKHSYVDVVTAPTCTEKGYTTHTCSCGDTYVDSYTNPKGHTYVDVVTEPTCTKQGYTTHTCSCGASYVDSYTNPKGHTYVDVVTKPTCTKKGYTTHTCSCGDVVVDTYVDALGHEYADGECIRCHEKDPSLVPECVAEKNATLANGTFIFTLGGNRIGEYTFAQSGSGWTIKGTDGKYLGFANNAFTYSDTAFVWTYSNNAFTTSVTSSSSNPWGGFGGFGGWGNWGNTTTTYYLTYANGRFNASTNSNGSNAGFITVVTSDTHSFGKWTDNKNGTHSHVCTNCGYTETENCEYTSNHTCSKCGAYDPKYVKIDVSVSVNQNQSSSNPWGGWGWNWWGGNTTTTTSYTATITANATGTTVQKVEYSTNNGTSWTTGNTFTSNSQIGSFLIRVTDGNGNVHNFRYDGTRVVAQ